jgi:hypothetical protein
VALVQHLQVHEGSTETTRSLQPLLLQAVAVVVAPQPLLQQVALAVQVVLVVVVLP